MLRKLALAIGVLLVLAVVGIALQPSEFVIERRQGVDAPPAVVFALVNDLGAWPGWSPWETKDPSMQRDYSEVRVGEGAWYAWSGNEEVGSGRMTITASESAARVGLRLEFLEPFPATNDVEFRFEPRGAGTEVAWAMHGYNDFVGKAVSLLFDMDAMVGADFESGLAKLRAEAERDAASGGRRRSGRG